MIRYLLPLFFLFRLVPPLLLQWESISFTYEPASESWSRFMSPFLLSPHYRIRGYPKIPLFFYPEFQTNNLFITRVKRIYSLSFTLSCGNEKAGGFPASFYSLQTINLPKGSYLSCQNLRQHTMFQGTQSSTWGSEKLQVFQFLPTYKHTHTCSLSHLLPAFPLPISPPPLPFFSLTLLTSIQGDVNGNVHRCSSCQSARLTGQRAQPIYSKLHPLAHISGFYLFISIVPQPGHWVPAPGLRAQILPRAHIDACPSTQTQKLPWRWGRRISRKDNSTTPPRSNFVHEKALKRPRLWNSFWHLSNIVTIYYNVTKSKKPLLQKP